MRGASGAGATPLRKPGRGAAHLLDSMPVSSSTATDPEALAPPSSISGIGSRDLLLDNEKAALLARTGSKNLRAAVSQAPKEVSWCHGQRAKG